MQSLDYDELIRRSKLFRERLVTAMTVATGPRHDIVQVVQIAIWYAGIYYRLPGRSLYQIERQLEPAAFGKSADGFAYHRNKWNAYQVGTHKPNRALVSQVDQCLPGTERLLNHPLWDAIRGKKTSAQLWSLGIGQLAPDIQRILASLGSQQITHLRQAKIGRRFLKQLEIRAGPDSLAGLIILLRKAVDDGRQELLLEIGTSIYYVALMMCAHLPYCNFADEIFYLLNRFVFPLVKDEQQSICLGHNFAASAASQRLNMMALQLEDAELIGFSPSDHIKAMNKMLEGGYGWDIKYAFAPPMKMLGGRTIDTEKTYQLLESAARLRAWGWEQLNSGRKEKLPPHHLW